MYKDKTDKLLESEVEAIYKQIHIKITQLIILGDLESYKKGEPWETIVSIKREIKK